MSTKRAQVEATQPAAVMSPANGWEPLLHGQAARAAWDAIDAISDELCTYFSAAERPLDATLAGGAAGAAIFLDYHARALGGEPDRDRLASSLLREAAGSLATGTRGVGLLEGVAGVFWAVTHLRGTELDPSADASLARIDLSLLAYLSRSPWTEHFDLVGGLVGLGVYGLERLPRLDAISCVEHVVNRLDELAERDQQGVTWRTPQALLPDGQQDALPNGWHNLGIAHGVPGIIGFLAGACAAGIAVERARPLLHGAVSWLLAQQLPDGALARFAHCIAPELAPSPSRLSWCFGDAGIAATLLLAARAEQMPAWEQAAIAIARHAAARGVESSGVEDTGLCHGAAGLAHIFNRLSQTTGEPTLAAAARAWFERTLTMRQPVVSVAGFPACEPDDSGTRIWRADPGLLTGTAGVGLALLAAVTTVEPVWDRALLLSTRPDTAHGIG
jgi:lantibiotic biosynthesis protein